MVIGCRDLWPVYHESQGYAKSKEIAHWLFSFSGWKQKGSFYPLLAFTLDLKEPPQRKHGTRIWVLNKPVCLN